MIAASFCLSIIINSMPYLFALCVCVFSWIFRLLHFEFAEISIAIDTHTMFVCGSIFHLNHRYHTHFTFAVSVIPYRFRFLNCIACFIVVQCVVQCAVYFFSVWMCGRTICFAGWFACTLFFVNYDVVGKSWTREKHEINSIVHNFLSYIHTYNHYLYPFFFLSFFQFI